MCLTCVAMRVLELMRPGKGCGAILSLKMTAGWFFVSCLKATPSEAALDHAVAKVPKEGIKRALLPAEFDKIRG